MSGTSTSTPTTVANAAPNSSPDRLIAAATGPHRTDFSRGVVADGDNEVERRRIELRELGPVLAAKILGRHTIRHEEFERSDMRSAVEFKRTHAQPCSATDAACQTRSGKVRHRPSAKPTNGRACW